MIFAGISKKKTHWVDKSQILVSDKIMFFSLVCMNISKVYMHIGGSVLKFFFLHARGLHMLS